VARLLIGAADPSRREPVDPAAVRELLRSRSYQDLVSVPGVDWLIVAGASRLLPPSERLPILGKCLKDALPSRGNAGAAAAFILQTDRAAGMRALDRAIAVTRPEDYRYMTIHISRVSPEGLLKLYKANPLPRKLFDLRQFTALAEADPDFAVKEAREYGEEEALGHAAVGIARNDLPRARQILSELSEKTRERVQIGFIENYLVAHPRDTKEAAGEQRITILRQAAWRIHSKRGSEGLEELLSSLSEPGERGMVLAYVAEQLARSGNPQAAVALVQKIEPPHIFVSAACSVVEAMMSAERGEAFETGSTGVPVSVDHGSGYPQRDPASVSPGRWCQLKHSIRLLNRTPSSSLDGEGGLKAKAGDSPGRQSSSPSRRVG